jgi:glutamine synthetase
MGYLATFMCRPALKGYCASGWHLHQSLVDTQNGSNLFTPERADEQLSQLGRAFLAGLLRYAVPATVFAVPTINGYRRFRANSVAPDRVTWCHDNRGAMIRVLGGVGDDSTRLENRVGEPSANPYLYILSQIVAGLAGIDDKLEPPPADAEPYVVVRTMLPTSWIEAIDSLEAEPLFRRQLGDHFIEYYAKLKRTEAQRYVHYVNENASISADGEPTEWEQREYFDFF